MPSDFVLDWERALGYRGDPFADKIFEPASRFLVNRVDEKEKINWFFIKGYFYGSILGEHGVGKTMILKWLQERLRKYNRIHCVYINAAVFREQINIPHQILLPLLSYYERNWSRPHQNVTNFDYVSFMKKKLGQKSVALLVDNAHSLTDRNMELLKVLREEGLKLQVIASTTQSDYEKSRLSELGNDDLNLTLRRLTFEESKDMIKRRIEAFGGRGVLPFEEESLKALHEKADKNPRQFIHFCRDEAIRVLIHEKERSSMMKLAEFKEREVSAFKKKQVSQPEARPAEPRPAPKPVQAHHPIQHHEAHPQTPGEKKKFFNVKFDFGRKVEEPKYTHNLAPPPQVEERKGRFGNEHLNPDLVNRLASSSQKKKFAGREPISDVDRILREMSDDMDDQ